MANRATRKLNGAQTLLLLSAALVVIAGPVGSGLLTAPVIQAQAGPPQSTSAAPSEPPKIEVSSIRRSAQPGPRFGMQSGGFNVTGTTVQLLLQIAYGVQHFQISGAPGWVWSERFDIIAKLDGVTGDITSSRRTPVLMRSLLEDRFQLKLHRETRQGPIYMLVPEPHGHKLQRTAGLRPGYTSGERGYVSGTMDMTTFTNWLSWRLERPVIDKTGLSGPYDIELIWTPDAGQRSSGLPAPAPPPPPPPPPLSRGEIALLPPRTPPPFDPDGPSIFTALKEQLGVRLESGQGPVEILVIDRLERPSEN